MFKFTTTLLKFGEKGEKTGWTYIEVPPQITEKLKPGNKKSFRVKGRLDNYAFATVALIPMGDGYFIMAINAAMRKAIGKKKGAVVKVQIQLDEVPPALSTDLIECLADEPVAKQFFTSLPKSEQNYFSKWIEGAKTDATKTKRIAQAINGFTKGLRFGPMLRALKANKDAQRGQSILSRSDF